MFPRSRTIINYTCLGVLGLLWVGFLCLTGGTGALATLLASVAVVGITITNAVSIAGGGLSIQRAVTRTGSGSIALEETLTVAQSGTLTTRTDADTGEITMSDGGHTIATSDVVDVYWDGGVQYGITVGTVSGTAVPIDSGSGDDLPSTSTAVTIVVQSTATISIDGDNTGILGIVLETNDQTLTTAGHIQFLDSGSSEIAEIDLVANVPQIWDITGGSANPFTGNPIVSAKVSQAGTSSTETYKLKIIGVQDATP